MKWFALVKKAKYIAQSLFLTLLLSYAAFGGRITLGYFLLLLICTLVSTYFIHVPNISKNNYFYVVLIPVEVIVSSALTFTFFPNLGVPIKLLALTNIFALSYAVSLVNNIFLVIYERDQTFPLYRAAVTWSQIILVVVSIPLFAGIYKTSWNPLLQNSVSGISAFLFCIYTYWVLGFDKDYPAKRVGERLLLSCYALFAVAFFGLSLSFFPSETFIRSLFVSSILMSALGYIQSHYKNQLDSRIVLEYASISLVFMLLTLLFRP